MELDREKLALAVHHHFCHKRSEKEHKADEHDYDKADEINEILARLEGE